MLQQFFNSITTHSCTITTLNTTNQCHLFVRRKKRLYRNLFSVNVILKKEVQHFLLLLAAAASAENLASQIKLLLKKTVFTASSIFWRLPAQTLFVWQGKHKHFQNQNKVHSVFSIPFGATNDQNQLLSLCSTPFCTNLHTNARRRIQNSIQPS